MVILAVLVAALLATSGQAGIGDDVCPDAAGEFTNTCPTGQVGVPYSITFHLPEGQGCGPGQDTWSIVGGDSPPGLSMSSEGTLSGTPTQAGVFVFFIQMALPDTPDCNGSKDTTQRRMTLLVTSSLPKLTLGPEATPPGTRGVSYSLQMTASVTDPKTWSILAGALPPGLTLDASTGLISGTPTTAGTSNFVVLAKLNGDSRADTKALGIVVRDPVTIAAVEPFANGRAQSEATIRFNSTLPAVGGLAPYTWSLSTGSLPPGLKFANGAITGTPTTAGSYAFAVTVADAEGRQANYSARIVVAKRLAITTLLLRAAKAGKLYGAKLKTTGGVKPTSWRARGAIPPRVSFNTTLGTLTGVPRVAGRYRVTFTATDDLGVTSRKSLTLVVGR